MHRAGVRTMRVSRIPGVVFAAVLFATPVALPAQGAAPAKPPQKKAAQPRPAKPAPVEPAAAPTPAVSEPEVLTNASVVKMLAAGLDPEIVIAKINSSQAKFTLDT